jgi:ligand-binding sensor domain-containing protein
VFLTFFNILRNVLKYILIKYAHDKTLDSWNTYSKKDGLVGDNISAIAVDKDYVWFGTYNAGVSKYSKTNQAFTSTYTKRDLLSSDKISDIAVDGINIWFGTAEAGVQRYIKPVNTWTIYTHSDGLASDNISCIAIWENEIWFGARESGVSKYDKKIGNFTTFVEAVALPDNNVMDLEFDLKHSKLWAATAKGLGMYDLKRKEWSHYGKENGLPSDYITTLNSGSETLYIGTAQGLGLLDEKSLRWKPCLKEKFITDLEVADNFIWTGTSKGLFRVSADGETTSVAALADKRVTCIESDGLYLWVGTKDGLWKYNTITEETSLYTTAQGIGNNFINVLLVVDASVWVGTRGGLSKYDETTDTWHTYTEQDGLPNNNVQAIVYDSNRNSLWVGTPAGLAIFSIDKETFTTVLEDYNIKNIEASGDSLWLSTTTGMIQFDIINSTSKQHRSHPESEPLREWNVSNLVSDGDALWFSNWSASTEGAIIRFDRRMNIWKRYTKEEIFHGEEKPITWVRWVSVDIDSVWFATDYGVLRYDNRSDIWHHNTASDGLASNDVQKIVVGDDSIWVIAASGNRISKYDKANGKWTVITLEGTLPIDSVKSIAIDGEDVWIGLSASGIRKFNKDHKTKSKVREANTGSWTSYTVADGLAQNSVGWISADERYVWVGHIGRSSDSALSRYDKVKHQWQIYSTVLLLNNEILKVIVGDRYTWILYPFRKDTGCTQFDRKAEQWTTVSLPEGGDSITDVIEDGEYIWFSTVDDGIFSFRTASGEWTLFEDFLPHDQVTDHGLLVDENSVWVAQPVGLCRYDKKLESWTYYTKEQTLEGEDVYALAVDDRYVWCGTDKGLSRYDKIRGDWENFKGERKWGSSSGRLINNFVLSLAVDERYVWVGTISGASRYDKIAATWESFTRENGLPGERILSIALDTNHVWMGTDFGIGRYPKMADDPNAWIPYTAEVSIMPVDSKEYVSTLVSNEVQCVAVDEDYLWVGTKRGVSRYDKSIDNWVSYTSEDGLIADAVSSIAVTKDAVWFGTVDGVSMYNPKSRDWITFRTEDGLASNKITCILYDGSNMWFGTFDAGLTRYDLKEKRWITYTKADGLAHNGVLSIAADLDYLWVGTRHGLSRYDKITDTWTTYAGTR